MTKKISKKATSHERKKESEKSKTNKDQDEKKGNGADFWERVSDDVASGYTTPNDKDEVLNEDQLSDDHESGNKID